MPLTPEEEAIRARLEAYLVGKPYRFHPDPAKVERILRLLAKRKKEFGEAYCPCRLVLRKPELDRRIICPCIYHEKEIAERGRCHCELFVAAPSQREGESSPSS